MPEKPTCEECGAVLPANAPRGLCPRCLLGMVIHLPPGDRGGVAAPAENRTGDRIGRYKLLQQIGEGGCGIVYMAEQEEPVRRRVALKVIKLGMDTRSVIARFEAERQALALMDHPNIARVLDAGATEAGRPYFVMELVKGIRITDYCDRNHLPTRDRLDLFIKACSAIQHAHQKGIIHRDIKPSNVLVTLHDGVPVPKVIDFGIAKATEGRLTDKTLFTAFDQFIGTPAYTSPEQAEMSGLDIDTRSDIYALGVLLYELLTGKTPFDTKDLLASGLDAMRKTIREQEPVRPSTRLSTMLEGELTGVARHRQTDAPRLIYTLRGDLDWVVMKCLEKDRARRYDTANGLATDLQRYLADEPVVARPPSRVYRFRKLIHRNKILFGAAGAALGALVIGLVVSIFSLVREREAHQRAARASTESRMTLAASDFSQAIHLIADDNPVDALAYLTRSLSLNPTNNAASTRLITLLVQHAWMLPSLVLPQNDEVLFVQFSPDGMRVVTASSDQTARVWDARSGRALTGPLTHQGAVNSAQFSLDGLRVVTASADQTAMVWDAQSGRPTVPALKHDDAVFMAGFSPNGERVVTASGDGTARVWDARTGRAVTDPLKHGGRVRTAEFDPTGALVVTASEDLTARVWDAETGRSVAGPLKHGGWVNGARFSRNGKRIVTASSDHTARVWDAQTGRPVTPPLKHGHQVAWAEFSPDGMQVVTASLDHTARVWDAQTGGPVTGPLHHGNVVCRAQFGPEGRRIVTASDDNTARVWDTRTGRAVCEPLHHDGAVKAAQFSPDGKRIITASDDREVRIWDALGGQALGLPFQHPLSLRAAFSRDGKRLVTAANRGMARVWDSRSGRPLSPPMEHANQVLWAEFSPDGKSVLTASLDHTARIWDAQRGQPIGKALVHLGGVTSARFSPSGRRVVTVSLDNTARVWDARTGEPLTPPLVHGGEVKWAEFSFDSARVVTASRDKTARVWDAQSGSPVSPPIRHKDQVLSARFSPNGANVATASLDHTARVWDARSGQPLGEILRHGATVRSAQFSPDGKRIVTISEDRTARVWDAETSQPVTKPLKHGAVVVFAEFSPDGRRIATVGEDSTLRLWDADTGSALAEPVKEAGGSAGVEFTPDGSRLVMGCVSTRVWDLPPVGGSCPDWLLLLTEAISGERVNSRNQLVTTDSNRVAILQSVRERLRSGRADDWTCWGRWFLADPGTRTISPYSSMTLAEYVANRIETGTTESIDECRRLPGLDDGLLRSIELAQANLDRQQNAAALPNSPGGKGPQNTATRGATPELGAGSLRGRQVIFEDTLENGWKNWSWAEVDLTNASPVYTGTQSISVLPGPMAALYLHRDGLAATNFDQLSFWVNGGASSKQLYLQATLMRLAQPGVPMTIPGGMWTQVVEPLSALGVESQPSFDGFWLQESTGAGQGIFYVDQIELQRSGDVSETSGAPPPSSGQSGSHPDVPR